MFERLRSRVVSIEELLRPVFDAEPELRVGWADDFATVRVRSVERFRAELRTLIASFRSLAPQHGLLADVSVSTQYRRVDVRIAHDAAVKHDAEKVRAALDGWIKPLAALVQSLELGWNGTYFHACLALVESGPELQAREDFPELPQTGWDERYQARLTSTSWSSLRHEAFRFARVASLVADWALKRSARRVLIPSSGLCIDPWLFACRGFDVVASDLSMTALDTVATAPSLPRMYGADAMRRWDIEESASYGGCQPDRFEPMPELSPELGRRIAFVQADWAALPLATHSVDVVFATNALPREDGGLIARVVDEWLRVVARDGFIFSLMHNPSAVVVEAGKRLTHLGWQRIDALHGETATGASFQEYFSSG